ncbi:unnamed protein product [Amoebophrya sp. A25]|nr:unnamed protein product [Amoebophrya sp. A25]|eukprot:GSA25T00020710001.1
MMFDQAHRGQTCLHLLSQRDDLLPFVRVLVEEGGATPFALDAHNNTPLLTALRCKAPRVAGYLLSLELAAFYWGDREAALLSSSTGQAGSLAQESSSGEGDMTVGGFIGGFFSDIAANIGATFGQGRPSRHGFLFGGWVEKQQGALGCQDVDGLREGGNIGDDRNGNASSAVLLAARRAAEARKARGRWVLALLQLVTEDDHGLQSLLPKVLAARPRTLSLETAVCIGRRLVIFCLKNSFDCAGASVRTSTARSMTGENDAHLGASPLRRQIRTRTQHALEILLSGDSARSLGVTMPHEDEVIKEMEEIQVSPTSTSCAESPLADALDVVTHHSASYLAVSQLQDSLYYGALVPAGGRKLNERAFWEARCYGILQAAASGDRVGLQRLFAAIQKITTSSSSSTTSNENYEQIEIILDVERQKEGRQKEGRQKEAEVGRDAYGGQVEQELSPQNQHHEEVGHLRILLRQALCFRDSKEGNSALHWAAMNDHLETCQALLRLFPELLLLRNDKNRLPGQLVRRTNRPLRRLFKQFAEALIEKADHGGTELPDMKDIGAVMLQSATGGADFEFPTRETWEMTASERKRNIELFNDAVGEEAARLLDYSFMEDQPGRRRLPNMKVEDVAAITAPEAVVEQNVVDENPRTEEKPQDASPASIASSVSSTESEAELEPIPPLAGHVIEPDGFLRSGHACLEIEIVACVGLPPPPGLLFACSSLEEYADVGFYVEIVYPGQRSRKTPVSYTLPPATMEIPSSSRSSTNAVRTGKDNGNERSYGSTTQAQLQVQVDDEQGRAAPQFVPAVSSTKPSSSSPSRNRDRRFLHRGFGGRGRRVFRLPWPPDTTLSTDNKAEDDLRLLVHHYDSSIFGGDNFIGGVCIDLWRDEKLREICARDGRSRVQSIPYTRIWRDLEKMEEEKIIGRAKVAIDVRLNPRPLLLSRKQQKMKARSSIVDNRDPWRHPGEQGALWFIKNAFSA